MKRGWKILSWSENGAIILFSDGEMMEIRSDGRTGYGWVEEYIEIMSLHHKGQILAADGILQRLLGSKYAVVKTFRRIYLSHLTIISMRCAFTPGRNGLHYDGKGDFRFSHTPCPIRPVCPFNGFRSDSDPKGPFGCNPIYETGLTPRQVEVARMLVESPLELSEIADVLHLTEGRIRNIASEIYDAMGVKSRLELMFFLKGKRLG